MTIKEIGTSKVFRGGSGPHWVFHKHEPLADTAEVLDKELCLCYLGTYLLCLASDAITSSVIKLAKNVYGKKNFFEEARNIN